MASSARKGNFFFIAASLLLSSSMTVADSDAAPQTPASTEELVRQSHLIFEGRVEKTNGSNLKALRASDFTAIVRVISVLYAEPGMMNLANQDVTVQSRGNTLKLGEEAIFLTDVWLYGENLAVIENARFPLASLEALRKAIPEAKERLADASLRARLMQAEVVIAGRVDSIKPLPFQEPRQEARSEHNPDWWSAEIVVESSLKGTAPGSHVTVAFPRSNDVMWFRAPKFRKGDSGVWLLHAANKLPGVQVLQAPFYTALDPLDFQSSASVQHLRVLLKAAP